MTIIITIKIYQYVISPYIRANCRFHPTCSSYGIDAIKKFGIFKGLYLTIKRILRCNPFGGIGYDPLIECNKTNKVN